MFDGIKKKLAYYIIKKKYAVEKEAISFKKFYSEAKEVLVTVPDTLENFSQAKKVLSQLANDNKKVMLLIKENLLESLKRDQNLTLITYSPEKLTRLNLPDEELAGIIEAKKIDLFIDLDLNESLLNYAIASLSKAKIAIGFQKEMSDRFYNFQIPAPERNYEFSYGILLNSLRMF